MDKPLATQKAKSRHRDEPVESTEINILIVDDHPIVRRGLIELINQEDDLNVLYEAEDYHQALAVMKDNAPDLAIVDLTLNGIGGLELVKQLKLSHPELPVLVLSMHDETLYAERTLRAGSRGYIMKQEGADRLVTAIRTVMRGEVYVSEKMASRLLGKMVGGASPAASSPLERLSDRELEVFELLGNGMGTRQIAEKLCVSIKTIESHREHIKEKLNLKNATELVQHATQWAMREGGV